MRENSEQITSKLLHIISEGNHVCWCQCLLKYLVTSFIRKNTTPPIKNKRARTKGPIPASIGRWQSMLCPNVPPLAKILRSGAHPPT